MELKLVYAILLVLGFFLEWILYNTVVDRAGGIVTIQIITLYTLINPYFSFSMIVNVALSYIIIDYIYKTFLVYGRRLLFTAIFISLLITVPSFFAFGIERLALVSIIPGIVAYNIHRERDLIRTLKWTTIKFMAFLSIGYALLQM